MPLTLSSGSRFLPAVIFLVSAFLIGSCAGSRDMPSRQVEQKLMQEYRKWQGTPYRLGGTTRSGVDCSAFIQIVYRDAFGIDLPRTTSDQLRAGSRARPDRLRVGDLIFFRTGRRTLHVGIVLSNGRFMHASTSRGVEITELNQSYWRRHFIEVRRVL